MHCPWYLLEYRTDQPLAAQYYFTYWYRVYVLREFVLMRPMNANDLTQSDQRENSVLRKEAATD